MESDPHVTPGSAPEEPDNRPTDGEQSRPLAAEKAVELLRAIAPAELADALAAEEREVAASDKAAAVGRAGNASRVSAVLGPLPGAATAQQTRSLNDAVHQILIIGLGISTVLLVAGLLAQLLTQGALPETTLHPAEAFRQTLRLRSAGFLSLGLLVLMITPIVRVIGSIGVFIWERDRRYTLITLAVLLVMLASVLLGGG